MDRNFQSPPNYCQRIDCFPTLYCTLFQRFIMNLSEHLVRCDTDGKDFDTHWYRWTVGRLQQVFMGVSIGFISYIGFFFFLKVLGTYDTYILVPTYSNTCLLLYFSIMNKFRSTVQLWKHCCLHLIWTHIF